MRWREPVASGSDPEPCAKKCVRGREPPVTSGSDGVTRAKKRVRVRGREPVACNPTSSTKTAAPEGQWCLHADKTAPPARPAVGGYIPQVNGAGMVYRLMGALEDHGPHGIRFNHLLKPEEDFSFHVKAATAVGCDTLVELGQALVPPAMQSNVSQGRMNIRMPDFANWLERGRAIRGSAGARLLCFPKRGPDYLPHTWEFQGTPPRGASTLAYFAGTEPYAGTHRYGIGLLWCPEDEGSAFRASYEAFGQREQYFAIYDQRAWLSLGEFTYA